MCPFCFALTGKFSGIIIHDHDCPSFPNQGWADKEHA